MHDFWPNVLNELNVFTFLARQKQKNKKKLSVEFAPFSFHENWKFYWGFNGVSFEFFLKEFRRMFDFFPNVLNELKYFHFPS